MIGEDAPAPGEANDLDSVTYPPEALPHQPGRVREYSLLAEDKEIEELCAKARHATATDDLVNFVWLDIIR